MTVEFKRTPGGAILLDGNALRDETVANIRREIDAAGNPSVCLATVLVGDDRPSHIYVANKHKKAGEAGMLSHGVALNGKASQAQVEDEVGKLAVKREMQRRELEAKSLGLERKVQDQQFKNIEMYKASMATLERYEKFGLGDAILAREPFTAAQRVKFQSLVQDFADQLTDARISPEKK